MPHLMLFKKNWRFSSEISKLSFEIFGGIYKLFFWFLTPNGEFCLLPSFSGKPLCLVTLVRISCHSNKAVDLATHTVRLVTLFSFELTTTTNQRKREKKKTEKPKRKASQKLHFETASCLNNFKMSSQRASLFRGLLFVSIVTLFHAAYSVAEWRSLTR